MATHRILRAGTEKGQESNLPSSLEVANWLLVSGRVYSVICQLENFWKMFGDFTARKLWQTVFHSGIEYETQIPLVFKKVTRIFFQKKTGHKNLEMLLHYFFLCKSGSWIHGPMYNPYTYIYIYTYSSSLSPTLERTNGIRAPKFTWPWQRIQLIIYGSTCWIPIFATWSFKKQPKHPAGCFTSLKPMGFSPEKDRHVSRAKFFAFLDMKMMGKLTTHPPSN